VRPGQIQGQQLVAHNRWTSREGSKEGCGTNCLRNSKKKTTGGEWKGRVRVNLPSEVVNCGVGITSTLIGGIGGYWKAQGKYLIRDSQTTRETDKAEGS